MSLGSIKYSELYNVSKLFGDYIKNEMIRFYDREYASPDSLESVIAEIDKAEFDRESLAGILRENNKRLGASDQTLANIQKLKEKNSYCVFAGQQTAFCCNPMYVVYKAFTAAKLAEKYHAATGRTFIPCFWMATDDHDFEEIRSANFLRRSGEVETITYKPAADPSGLAISEIVLDNGVREFGEKVSDELIDTEFKAELMESFNRYYQPGEKLSEAFARMLNKLIGDYGIVLVDPNFDGLKRFFAEVYSREITEHQTIQSLFDQRCEALRNDGYHNQVHKTGEYLNLFYHNPERLNIKICDDKYCVDGDNKYFTMTELDDMAKKDPKLFSPNVLLRAVAQCKAFPTVTQVVGPSELAYFGQIKPIFDHMGVAFPIVYPRAGMTIIEPHIKKIMGKYELDLGELNNRFEQLIGEVVEKLFPSESANSVSSMNSCIRKDLDKHAQKLKDSDQEGYRHLVNFKKHIDYELNVLEKKLKASNKKRHEELAQQLQKAHDFLFPNSALQERMISPLYYANKFGLSIFDKVYENLEIDKPVHSILEL